jgi:two-component system sensor kinase FixL
MFSRESQALMEAAVDAVIVIDHRGVMLAANDAVSRIFGYASAELLGQNVTMLMPEPDRSAHDVHLQRYLETGVAKIIGIGRDVLALRKDGTVFPARLSVGRIAESSPARFVGMLRDISAEQEAWAALKLQRDRAQAFLELHDAILLELDTGYRVRDINSRGADLLGAPAEDIRGRNWLDFIQPGLERERARMLLASASSSGISREREFDGQDISGARRRIYWRCIALRSVDGSPAGWLCSGVDVTERELRAQDAHVAHDRLTRVARLATMGEMAAGIAHEINQPLTAITTYARACERYLELPTPDFNDLREAVREIGVEGLRAGDIVRKLRRLVRNDAAEERHSLVVNSLIEELSMLLQADARVHGVDLRIRLAADLPAVMANGVQLQQVILNLARNAFEALQESPPDSRHVEIATLRAFDGGIEIRVTDNGPGVDPGIADRLFDPFATTKGNGTGLGLAISRTIVQAHGGSIGVRAVEPRGSTFCVRVPVQEECLT